MPRSTKSISVHLRIGSVALAVATASVVSTTIAVPAHGYLPWGGLSYDDSTASVAVSPGDGLWTTRDDGFPAALSTDTRTAQTWPGAGKLKTPGDKDPAEVVKYPAEIAASGGTIVADPLSDGYYIITKEGDIARFTSTSLPSPWDKNDLADKAIVSIVGAAMTPSGQGMWILDRSGAVFTIGDAESYGDVLEDSTELTEPTGIVPSPSGLGYYIVSSDGGVHGRGDAAQALFGSTGGDRPGGNDITGIALSLTVDGQAVNGYWLVDKTGGVHTFGSAPFHGSTGGSAAKGDYVTGITRLASNSYAIVHQNGRAEIFFDVRQPAIDLWPQD